MIPLNLSIGPAGGIVIRIWQQQAFVGEYLAQEGAKDTPKLVLVE